MDKELIQAYELGRTQGRMEGYLEGLKEARRAK